MKTNIDAEEGTSAYNAAMSTLVSVPVSEYGEVPQNTKTVARLQKIFSCTTGKILQLPRSMSASVML
jgi:hypothetical protein